MVEWQPFLEQDAQESPLTSGVLVDEHWNTWRRHGPRFLESRVPSWEEHLRQHGGQRSAVSGVVRGAREPVGTLRVQSPSSFSDWAAGVPVSRSVSRYRSSTEPATATAAVLSRGRRER